MHNGSLMYIFIILMLYYLLIFSQLCPIQTLWRNVKRFELKKVQITEIRTIEVSC